MGAGAQLGKVERAAREAMVCAGDEPDQGEFNSLPADFARHFAQGFAWTLGAGIGIVLVAAVARAVFL